MSLNFDNPDLIAYGLRGLGQGVVIGFALGLIWAGYLA